MIKKVLNFLFKKGIKVPFIVFFIPLFFIISILLIIIIANIYYELVVYSEHLSPQFSSERIYSVKNLTTKAEDFLRLEDGGYLILGTLEVNDDDSDIYLIRTDHNGDTIWTKRIGSEEVEEGYKIVRADGNCFLILASKGKDKIVGGNYIYTIKIDNQGKILSNRTFGDSLRWIPKHIVKNNNNFLIIGTSIFASKNQVYLINVNDNLDPIWTKKYFSEITAAHAYCRSTDNKHIIGGVVLKHNCNDKGCLMKVDTRGNLEWIRIIGGADTTIAFIDEIVRLKQYEYLAFGKIRLPDKKDQDIFTFTFDDKGKIHQFKVYINSFYNYISSIYKHPSSGYIGTGRADFKLYLFRIDDDGNILWSQFVQPEYRVSYPVGGIINDNNEIVIIGTTRSYGRGLCSIFFVKTDTLGNIIDKGRE